MADDFGTETSGLNVRNSSSRVCLVGFGSFRVVTIIRDKIDFTKNSKIRKETENSETV